MTDLIGVELDAAVALALGLKFVVESFMTNKPRPIAVWLLPVDYPGKPYSPSTDWSQGGPIIERERIELAWLDECQWCAIIGPRVLPNFAASGPTPLIAAMRAFVASKQ